MRLSTILNEGTDNLYHATSPHAALKILVDKQFKLTSNIGNDVETAKQYKDYEYYLSTTRSKVGDYHQRVYKQGLIMNLDGRWINQRYPVKPIDYWDRMWFNKETGATHTDRTSEAEDRVFSKEPTMPITPLQEIHVFWQEDANPDWNFIVRRIFIEAKKQGIGIWLYDDPKQWMAQNKAKAISIADAKERLQGQEKPSWGMKREDKYLNAWLELYYKKSTAELSDYGKKQYRELWGWGDLSQGFGNDLRNASKPNSHGYDAATKIRQIMRQQRLQTPADFIEFIKKKWEPIKDREHEAEMAAWRKKKEQEKQAANEDYDWEQDEGMDFVNPLPTIKDTTIWDVVDKVDEVLMDKSGQGYESSEQYAKTMTAMRNKYGVIRHIPLSQVICTEKYLDPEKIDAVRQGTSARSSSEYPVVIKYNNKYYAVDGNHRIVAAYLNGTGTVEVQILDADRLLQ